MEVATLLVLAVTSIPVNAQTASALAVRIDNQAAISEATMVKALGVGAGIYRRADIRIRLIAPTDPDATLTIVIARSKSAGSIRPANDSMGVAPSANDGTRGNVAYVFADRVERFAEQGGHDGALVLGCAIAHELGHLLLPVNAHTRDGIMRARWDSSFLPRTGAAPGFPTEQARLLRLRVESRIGNPPIPK